jgi:hypothetical protein
MSSFNVKSYRVNITNCATPYCFIMLFNSENVMDATYSARLDFSQLQELNDYSFTQDGNSVKVAMNVKLFDSVVDILRNEKPIWFTWYTSSGVCFISTQEEAVGEGETKYFPRELIPIIP